MYNMRQFIIPGPGAQRSGENIHLKYFFTSAGLMPYPRYVPSTHISKWRWTP